MERLKAESNRYEDDVFECRRRVNRLTVEIARLRDVDEEELKKERERNTWWVYLSSPMYGRVEETEDKKRHREVERLQRVASRSIKMIELAREEAELQRLSDFLKSTKNKIDAECKKREDERREEEAKTRAAEARKQAEFEKQQADVRRAEQERIWAEIRRRQQEADRVAREQREKLEREQAAAAEIYKKLEKQRRQEADRIAREQAAVAEVHRKLEKQRQEERAKREEQQQKDPEGQIWRAVRGQRANRVATKTSCKHAKFWPKIEGRQSCSHCNEHQWKFVLQCPDCKMIACAACRKSLRG